MKICAVLFDLDGVLVDATEWHYEALNRVLARWGFTITRTEHETTYNGLPTRRKLAMLSRDKGLPVDLHDCITALKQRHTRELIAQRCRPAAEKLRLLGRLKLRGQRLLVCSNAVRESCRLMLTKSGLWNFFDLVLSNEDVERPKPDPEIYQQAIARLNLRPDETVIVEDADHGVAAALASGGHVLRVAGFDEVTEQRVLGFLDEIEGGGYLEVESRAA